MRAAKNSSCKIEVPVGAGRRARNKFRAGPFFDLRQCETPVLGSWNPFYNDSLGRIETYLNGQAATGRSSGTSMAIVGQAVQSQVTILAYIDVFVALGPIAAVMVPLALTLRSVNRSAGTKPAH